MPIRPTATLHMLNVSQNFGPALSGLQNETAHYSLISSAGPKGGGGVGAKGAHASPPPPPKRPQGIPCPPPQKKS